MLVTYIPTYDYGNIMLQYFGKLSRNDKSLHSANYFEQNISLL